MKRTYKRYGRFFIDRTFIESDPITVRKIMGRCIILRAEEDYVADAFKYLAISPDFDEIAIGASWPIAISSKSGEIAKYLKASAG